MEFHIERGLEPEVAVALAREAGWPWTVEDVAARLALAPEGHFTARRADGAVAGCVSAQVWRPAEDGASALAWIGGMVVRPDAQGQGLGRALLRRALEHARAEGAGVVGLDATEQGRPLYEKEGFVARGRTGIWSRTSDAPRPPPGPSGHFAIYPVSSCEIMELLAYDRPRFGASRAPWLAQLVAERPYQSFVAVDRETGAFSGLALAQQKRLGPVVADTPDAAAWLLWACEQAGAPARLWAWEANPSATAVLEAAGYRPEGRWCTRMTLGGPLPGEPERVYGIGMWSLG